MPKKVVKAKAISKPSKKDVKLVTVVNESGNRLPIIGVAVEAQVTEEEARRLAKISFNGEPAVTIKS